MPPVISVIVHPDIQGGGGLISPTYCFPHLLHNIRCTTICALQLVSPPLDPSTTGRCCCIRMGYYFAALTSWSAIGFAFSKRLNIDGIWLQSSPHKMISEAFWSSEGHNWLLWEDCSDDLMITCWSNVY